MVADMNGSYRMQAERRASLSRTPVPAARANGKAPLQLPPWGYGSGRPVVTTPNVSGARRPSRSRARSMSPGKQTRGTSASELADAVASNQPAALSHWSGSSTADRHDGTEASSYVVESKRPESVTSPKEINETSDVAAATGEPTQHPYGLQSVNDSIGDTVVIGGGPAVTSSSMETWTTYDGTSPSSARAPSTVSSPHSVVTSDLLSNVNTPHSPTSWLRRLSPTLLTGNDALFTTHLANCSTDATRAVGTLSSLISRSPLSDITISPILQQKTNEPVPLAAQEVVWTPLSQCSDDKSQEQKTVSSPANKSSKSGEITVNTPTSQNNDSKGSPLSAPKTDSAISPATTLPEANDQDESSLMVGLVKVRSRHTGLMIDCPILETSYENDVTKAVRQSSSHKVVLIKAVVPRWAWNKRGQITPDSSPPSSVTTTDRESVKMKGNKRKISLVSVNTQTSDTLIPPARRTTSEPHSTPASPAIFKLVPALEDNSQLMPSPKLSNCSARSKFAPRTLTEAVQPFQTEDRFISSPKNTSCQSSARPQIRSPTLVEKSNQSASPLSNGNVPVMPEKLKESGFVEGCSASMDGDSLMEHTIQTLKLDLQLSSGNNSDSESVTHAAKRSFAERFNGSLSSSSDDFDCGLQPPAHCQLPPTTNWSCAANAATTVSSDAIENFQTSSYVDETVVPTELPSSPPRQRPRRKPHTPTSQRRSPTSKLDNRKPRVDAPAERQSGRIISPINSAKARTTPESSSRLMRSSCAWRSAASNDDEVGGWPGCELSRHDSHKYEHQQQCQSSQQYVSSTTEYASRSGSSLSDRSKSTFHDCCEALATTTMSPTMSRSSKHDDWITTPTMSSSPFSGSQIPTCDWITVIDPNVTSGVSDTCTTEPLHYAFPADHLVDNFPSTTTGDIESTPHQSRHSHHRPTSHNKHAMEPKSKSFPEQRNNRPTFDAKRPGDRQRKWRAEASRRHHELAENSRSTGSMAVARNAASSAAGTKRQHSLSSSRYKSRDVITDTRRHDHDVSSDRRASSSRRQRCVMADNQRRGREQHAAASDMTSRRSVKQTCTSLGRNQRRGSPAIHASVSRSADNVSRHRQSPSNYSRLVAERSNKPKRVTQPHQHAERQSQAMFCECPPVPVVYHSPRSFKPFPPPVSDRHLPSSLNISAVTGTSFDVEPAQHAAYVQRQGDTYYDSKLPGAQNDHQRSNTPSIPPVCHQERLHRSARTGADELDHPWRDKAGRIGSRRRRKQVPVDSNGWYAKPDVSVRVAVPTVIERPAWRRY